jgi:tyrosyl-tRNA synthetase
VKVIAEDAVTTTDELLHARWLVLHRGKKNLAAIKVPGA